MWLVLAIINPFSEASKNTFSKIASKDVDSVVISWFNNLLPVIVFTPILFFIELKFTGRFFTAVMISGLINALTVVLYHKAISIGEVSEVIPMLSFTPLWLLIQSPLITGEFPKTAGLIGILLIVIGSYVLNIDRKKNTIFAPFLALKRNRGTGYMFFISFIWGISANFDKVAISESSVLQYLGMVNLVIFAGSSIYLGIKTKFKNLKIEKSKFNLFMVSSFATLSYIVHLFALSMAPVAYIIALKRSSSFITVIFSRAFLHEGRIKERLLGALIMFAGVLLIALF